MAEPVRHTRAASSAHPPATAGRKHGGGVEPIRLLVTGHDRRGRSKVISDRASPHTKIMHGIEAFGVTDLWKTFAIPADNDSEGDPCSSVIDLEPPRRGIVLRVVQFPPDKTYVRTMDRQRAFSSLGKTGAAAMSRVASAHRHPMMHRTNSVDYAIVLRGEVWSVMDEGESLMRAGDILVQRGTNHAWSNRTSRPALVCFVQIDANAARGARAPAKAANTKTAVKRSARKSAATRRSGVKAGTR